MPGMQSHLDAIAVGTAPELEPGPALRTRRCVPSEQLPVFVHFEPNAAELRVATEKVGVAGKAHQSPRRGHAVERQIEAAATGWRDQDAAMRPVALILDQTDGREMLAVALVACGRQRDVAVQTARRRSAPDQAALLSNLVAQCHLDRAHVDRGDEIEARQVRLGVVVNAQLERADAATFPY